MYGGQFGEFACKYWGLKDYEATPLKRPRPPFGPPDEGFLSFLTPVKLPAEIK